MGSYTPRIGDIGLTSISGAGGAGIRVGQWLNGDGWGKVQHAFVVVSPRTGGETETIIEAMPGGARHVKNWHPADETHYLRCPDVHRTGVMSAAMSLEGVPYSAADYLALAAHRFHIPYPHLKRFIKESGHMICSQLADHAALLGGWHLFKDDRWEGDVTPMDLEELYRAQRAARIKDGDVSR